MCKFKKYTSSIHECRLSQTLRCTFFSKPGFLDDYIKLLSDKLGTRFAVRQLTDDESEKNYFVQKYGERIITRIGVLERGSTKGIQDAVIEMYILGSTQKVYGSKNSSFGQIAAKLGNIDFIEVESK